MEIKKTFISSDNIMHMYCPRKVAETCILWHPGHKGSVHSTYDSLLL